MTPMENYISDTIRLLIERAQAARLEAKGGGSYEQGVSFGLFEALSLLHEQAASFQLSQERLGFPKDFDAENQLL